MPCYAFWIPSLSGKLSIKKDRVVDENVSDTDTFKVSASIDESSMEVVLSYRYDDNDQKVILAKFQEPKGCFMFYEVSNFSETESPLYKDLQSEFPNWLYHIFKEFFHIHKFHNEEEDSILGSRFFNSKDEYFSSGMTDVEFYLSEYEKRFRNTLKRVCDNREALEERRERPIRNYIKIYSANKELLNIFIQYEGEFTYYKSLRKSLPKNNTNVAKEHVEKIDRYDTEIRLIKERICNEFSCESAKIGTNVSSLGGIIGIVGVLISVISICLTCTNQTDSIIREINDETIPSIKAKLNSLNSSIEEIERDLDLFDARFDSSDSMQNLILKQQKILTNKK